MHIFGHLIYQYQAKQSKTKRRNFYREQFLLISIELKFCARLYSLIFGKLQSFLQLAAGIEIIVR